MPWEVPIPLSTWALVTIFPPCRHLELLSWRDILRPTWCRSLACCDSSTGLLIGCWSEEELRLYHWSSSSHRSCARFVFLSGIDCPVVPLCSSMQTRLFYSAISNFLRALANVESRTSMSRIIRPNFEHDDFHSFIFLAESNSLIHTHIAYVGKLEVDNFTRSSSSKCRWIGKFWDLILSASFFF